MRRRSTVARPTGERPTTCRRFAEIAKCSSQCCGRGWKSGPSWPVFGSTPIRWSALAGRVPPGMGVGTRPSARTLGRAGGATLGFGGDRCALRPVGPERGVRTASAVVFSGAGETPENRPCIRSHVAKVAKLPPEPLGWPDYGRRRKVRGLEQG